jgi:hypothetical protein
MDSTLKIAAGTGIILVIGSLGVAAYMVFLQKKAFQKLQNAVVPIEKLEASIRIKPFPNLSGAPTCVSAGKKAQLTSYIPSIARWKAIPSDMLPTGSSTLEELVGSTTTCVFDAESSTPGWIMTAVLPTLHNDTSPAITRTYQVLLDTAQTTLDADCALKIATAATHPADLILDGDKLDFLRCLPQSLERHPAIYTKGGIYVSRTSNAKCISCA